MIPLLRFFASLSFASRPPLARFRYWRIPKPAPEIEAKVRNEISTFSTLSKKKKKKNTATSSATSAGSSPSPGRAATPSRTPTSRTGASTTMVKGGRTAPPRRGRSRGTAWPSASSGLCLFSLSLFSLVLRALFFRLSPLSLSLSLFSKNKTGSSAPGTWSRWTSPRRRSR